jgi:hypothetical protein
MAEVNNNSDAVEDNTQRTHRQRAPRQRRFLPTPLLRLIVVFVAVVVIVVLIVVAVTASKGGDETAEYQQYMTAVTDILKQSDAIGVKLSALLTTPGDTNRKAIQTSLDDYVAKSQQLETKAKALQAPEEFVSKNVHQFFILVMTFRSQGLVSLKPSLINSLDTQDSAVVTAEISDALSYLTNSDFLYRTVFVKGATDIVKQKNIPGVTVPESQFLKDPDLASTSRAQEIIAQLKSTGNLQAVHGVAISKVVAQPDNQQLKKGQTYNLTSSEELAFLVTVENQGNMSEKDVAVTVSLDTETGDPQKITVTIPEIKPGKGKSVTATVTGLNPTEYGEVANLKVEIGPVAGEKVTDNNSLQAKVIFKL